MSRRKILCSSLISLRSFCVILGLCGILVLETLAESNLFVQTRIEGNNLEEFKDVGWIGYNAATHHDTPSKFKNTLAALDSGTVDGVWVENNPSPGSFVNFTYVFDTSDICDVTSVDLSIKYYAELATAYFYPCDSSSSSEYCYLVPSNANQWSNFRGRLRIPLDKIEIGGMLVPGGYIIFEEITITHDGLEGDDCKTTTSTTEATTEATTDGTEETADTEEIPPTTTPITTTDDGSTTEEPTTETTTTEEPEITEPPPVTTTEDPTDAPTTTDDPTDAPTTTDDPTDAPTTTDDPTDAPTTTDDPTDAPTTTDHPTDAPTTTDDPTDAPTTTDDPTDAPTTTDDPTDAPTTTDESTDAPTTTDESTDAPTTTDESTDAPTTDTTTDSTETPTDSTETPTDSTGTPTDSTETPTDSTETPTDTTEPPTGTTTTDPIVSSNPTSSTSLSSERTEASSISTSPLTPSSSTALTPPQPPPTVPPISSTPASDTGGGLSLQDILLYIILPISVGVMAFLGTVFYFGFRGYRLAGLWGKGGGTSKLNPAARTARQNDMNPQSSRMGPTPISQPNTSGATTAQGLSPHPVYAAPTQTNAPSNMAGANLHPTHGNVNPVSRSVALNIPNDEVDRLSDRSSFNSRGDRPLIYTGEYQGEFSKYLPRMRPKFD